MSFEINEPTSVPRTLPSTDKKVMNPLIAERHVPSYFPDGDKLPFPMSVVSGDKQKQVCYEFCFAEFSIGFHPIVEGYHKKDDTNGLNLTITETVERHCTRPIPLAQIAGTMFPGGKTEEWKTFQINKKAAIFEGHTEIAQPTLVMEYSVSSIKLLHQVHFPPGCESLECNCKGMTECNISMYTPVGGSTYHSPPHVYFPDNDTPCPSMKTSCALPYHTQVFVTLFNNLKGPAADAYDNVDNAPKNCMERMGGVPVPGVPGGFSPPPWYPGTKEDFEKEWEACKKATVDAAKSGTLKSLLDKYKNQFMCK